MEREARGIFTSALEKHLFAEYTSVSQAIELAQREILSTSSSRQRAEVLSSMNGDVFLNPKNEKRRLLALVAGSNGYGVQWPNLAGAVADARSIHRALGKAGYSSRLLLEASSVEFRSALSQLLSEARQNCKMQGAEGVSPERLPRGAVVFEEITPCTNVLVFVYVAGHGFVRDGITYLVMKDGYDSLSHGPTRADGIVSIEALRGQIAEQVAAQIIIADISRSVLQEDRVRPK